MVQRDIFTEIKALAAEYRALTDAYDAELRQAHNAGHGSLELIEHLRNANAMAPQVLDALKRYQAAVAALMASLHINK